MRSIPVYSNRMDTGLIFPLAKIDPTFSAILDINDIQENVRTHLTHFIERHKDLEEGKYVKILG